jgi:hypothetical protein
VAASSKKKVAKKRKRDARKPVRVPTSTRSKRPRRWHHLDSETQSAELLDAITSNVARLMDKKHRECFAAWRELLLDRGSARGGPTMASSDRRAVHNVVRNAVEAITADHAKDLARAMIVPVGGDWKLARKTKATQRALDGDWERIGADAYREGQIHDACVYGEGHLRVYPSFDRVAWRRVPPWCHLTEPREDKAGRLMTKYEVSAIDVDVLIEAYAYELDDDGKRTGVFDEELAEAIESSDDADRKLLDEESEDDDGLKLVMEAWRLPVRPGAEGPEGEGRYIICTSNCVLVDRPWKADFFPHSSIIYSRDPESTVHGPGLPERMARMQFDQNETDEIIAQNKTLIAGAKVEIANGADVDTDTFTNESGAIVKHNGPPGSVNIIAHSGNAIDLVQNARVDRMEMLTDQGINPMQTSGQLPEQVDSGKAQQVYRDNTKARHAMVGRQCERATIQLAKCHILAWEQIVDAGMKPVGMMKRRRLSGLEPLNYNDVRLSKEQFDVRTFPVSNLSDSMSERLSEVQSLQQAGYITPTQAIRAMNLGDTDQLTDDLISGEDLALDLIDAALDIDAELYAQGERIVATRVCNRQYLIEQGWRQHAQIEAHAIAGDRKQREERRAEVNRDLAALRDLIGSADTQLKQETAKAQAEAQAAAAAATPPQPPMAPPPQPPGPQLEVVQ